MDSDYEFDLFISHASEAKEDFVRDLAIQLAASGLTVWYDEFEIKVGDSLRESITRGIVKSRFGLLVISPHFHNKQWTSYEFSGLLARQMDNGKVILPIWYQMTKRDVVRVDPALANLVALDASRLSIPEIVISINNFVRSSGQHTAHWENIYAVGSRHRFPWDPKAASPYKQKLRYGITAHLEAKAGALPAGDIDCQVVSVHVDAKAVYLVPMETKGDPWCYAQDRYESKVVRGVVVTFLQDQVGVELEPGLVGTLPAHQMSYFEVLDARKLFNLRDEIQVKVAAVNRQQRSIELSQLPLLSNPWENFFPEQYSCGTEVDVKIEREGQREAVVTIDRQYTVKAVFRDFVRDRPVLTGSPPAGFTMKCKVAEIDPKRRVMMLLKRDRSCLPDRLDACDSLHWVIKAVTVGWKTFEPVQCADLVKMANCYQAKANIVKGDGSQDEEEELDLKSIMSLMMLGLRRGEVVTIKAYGSDADELVKRAQEYISRWAEDNTG